MGEAGDVARAPGGLGGEEELLGGREAVEGSHEGINLLLERGGVGRGVGGFGGQHLLDQGGYFGLLRGRGGGNYDFFEIIKTQYVYQPNNSTNPFYKKKNTFLYTLDTKKASSYIINFQNTVLSLTYNPYIFYSYIEVYNIYAISNMQPFFTFNRNYDAVYLLALVFFKESIKNNIKYQMM